MYALSLNPPTNTEFQVFIQLPASFNGIQGFQYADEQTLTDNNFYPYVQPGVDPATQKLGAFTFDGTTVSKQVLDLTPEELEQNAVNQSEANAVGQRQLILDIEAENIAQTLPDNQAAEVLDVFPFWSDQAVDYAVDFKVKRYDPSDTLVKLYRVVQAHTSSVVNDPLLAPALYTRVPFPGEILVWVQPTGAQDAYNTGDQVLYPDENGNIWESTVDANVFAPGVVPGDWVDLGPQ